ncbi:MAG TPA: transposase [Candidatus Saccharimonadia bacterium]|nr:transposase [Candidatus Saccharimonadia bacterium]
MDRLTCNGGLANAFAEAVCGLGYIRPTSIVACDHSDFNGLSAFVGAVQTRRGRAIPCLVETTYSLGLPAHPDAPKRKQAMRQARAKSEETLYGQVESALVAWAKMLGFWPRLVFDRGFGGTHLVRVLVEHKATFYIRLKAGRRVLLSDTWLPVRNLAATDTTIRLAELELRVVRSDDPKTGEPWYILTSDQTSTRDQIIRIYYHRFEVEETFKDLKHVLELKAVRFMKPLSLKVVLWFASLSLILSFLVDWWEQIKYPRHPKKQLSHYKQFFEALMREAYGPPTDMITGGLGK